MVEVFKTNVEEQQQAAKLLEVLTQHFPLSRINFDLDDCDRILRVEGDTVSYKEIIELITNNGYQCKILE
jgi:hypothetical protein